MSKACIRQLWGRSRPATISPTTAMSLLGRSSVSRQFFCSPTSSTLRGISKKFSSVAVKHDEDYNDGGDHSNHIYDVTLEDSNRFSTRHCNTCICGNDEQSNNHGPRDKRNGLLRPLANVVVTRFPCGSDHHEDEMKSLPSPLPEPKYSVHKRVLPKTLTSFSSEEGRKLLMEALFIDGTAESYWSLTQHFVNQGDPAFCGVTTLVMCLNALCIDPNIRWRGGWRYYGSEDVLLDRCCLSTERIRRLGISLEDFVQLGRCQGLQIELRRPEPRQWPGDDNPQMIQINNNKRAEKEENFSLQNFREDVQCILSQNARRPLLVVSFSRQALGQTGDGHFSAVAAYHEGSDQVLILDVARFKYAPFWVPVEDLYLSMQEVDSVTNKSRGWLLLYPPRNHACQHVTQEDRRPVEVVPIVGEKEICPVGDIRRRYCKANREPNAD